MSCPFKDYHPKIIYDTFDFYTEHYEDDEVPYFMIKPIKKVEEEKILCDITKNKCVGEDK